MGSIRRNLSVGIDPSVRASFLKFCEDAQFQKGDVADALISSFLSGKSLTPKQLIEQERERLKKVASVQPKSVSTTD